MYKTREERFEELDRRLAALYDKHVPKEGEAETILGELVRAVNRIVWRNWNDGDVAGMGYGKETVDPAIRFMLAHGNPEVCWYVSNLRKAAQECNGAPYDLTYQIALYDTVEAVCDLVENYPKNVNESFRRQLEKKPTKDGCCSRHYFQPTRAMP